MNEGIIRILSTSQCNYNCFFCHKEGILDEKNVLIDKDDIVFLYNTYNKYYNKDAIRISGGEPLLREDIIDVVKELHERGCNSFLTTNGYALVEKIEICKYLKRLNISIHSLDNKKYKEITNTNVNVEDIIKNIEQVRLKYPELDITIDVALLKNINTNEQINEFIKLAERLKVNLKFVELFMNNKEYLYQIEMLEKRIVKMGFKKINTYVKKTKYKKDNTVIYIAKCFCNINKKSCRFGEFCNKFNDLFISSDGKIQLCRLEKIEIDILKELKKRNESGLVQKLEMAMEKLGQKCLVEGGKIWN